MRYRPFGKSGMAVSAITLRLTGAPGLGAEGARALTAAALDSGINSLLIDGLPAPALAGAVQALATRDRASLFIGWRLRNDHGTLTPGAIQAMTQALEGCGLERLDLAIVDDPQGPELPADAAEALNRLRDAGTVGALAVASRGAPDPRLIASGPFAALSAPFNLSSGWAERERLRQAAASGLAVIGEDFWPQALRDHEARPAPRPSLWRRRTDPLIDVGGYGFLDDTPGWTAEEICLAYALGEPALATVQVSAAEGGQIRALAAAVDRDLPVDCVARIEMARFSQQEARRKTRLA